MSRHVLWVALLWIALTAVLEAVVVNVDLMPVAAAREAHTVDSAFRLLTLLGVPVFTFVVAVLLYSLVRFRSRTQPEQDGPPLTARPLVVGNWLAITGALAVYVMINPGLIGLAELRTHHQQPDLVIQVEGTRWQWKVTYPRYNVTSTKELVLPVGKSVRFDVTSVDVLHSFWVPAFRMKIDAVPGRVTTIYATPDRLTSAEEDHNVRLVCAELCGLGHALMIMPVRIVGPAAFDAWVAGNRAAGTGDGQEARAALLAPAGSDSPAAPGPPGRQHALASGWSDLRQAAAAGVERLVALLADPHLLHARAGG